MENKIERNDIMLLMKATNFAAIKHKKQLRKDGYTPYINHPIGLTLHSYSDAVFSLSVPSYNKL